MVKKTNISKNQWYTLDEESHPHTLGVEPSSYNEEANYCRWSCHGADHREQGKDWINVTVGSAEDCSWFLHDEELNGRVLLW